MTPDGLQPGFGPTQPEPLRFLYRNHRGEVSERVVQPSRLAYGSTEWHPEPQWLLEAYDLGKSAMRTFALRDVLEVLV